MVEDAKILFDRDGFCGAVLERLRKRLKELGAKRIWQGNAWYWDLKQTISQGTLSNYEKQRMDMELAEVMRRLSSYKAELA